MTVRVIFLSSFEKKKKKEMPEFAACCVCAIVCILLLEGSISDSIQPDRNNCEISRRPSLLKEGIIKDGLSDPPNGN